MHLSVPFAALLLAVAGVVNGAAGPKVIKEWRFASGTLGWTSGHTSPLRIENGALVVQTPGNDPILVSPAISIQPEVDDVLEVELASTTAGELQWFWRTSTAGKYMGFEPDATAFAKIPVTTAPILARTRPHWATGKPIIGLRVDPPEGPPGTYRIRAIRWLRPARVAPRPAAFQLPRDSEGWSTDQLTTPDRGDAGLSIDAGRPGARLVTPPLVAKAASSSWLTLDVTPPASAGPDGHVRLTVEYADRAGTGSGSTEVLVAPGRRARYSVRMEGRAGWQGDIAYLSVGPAIAAPGAFCLHGLSLNAQPPTPSLSAKPTGLEVQTAIWRTEARVPIAPRRIDIAKQAPPETHPVATDYTVAMWYFAAWEPEYDWDGWGQVGERSPWRIPLIYDSSDAAMEYNGIRFYRSSTRAAVDWHVHWMREHAVNLMVWDWYPHTDPAGRFSPGFFGNRALELGFLGKEKLGGPPVPTNRFAETMPFCVMWTNHAPNNLMGKGLQEYMVDQFLNQPNYYKVDGKPLVVVWSVQDLLTGAGGEAGARAALDRLRQLARTAGHTGVYITAISGLNTRAQAQRLGFDGVMGYNYIGGGGWRPETRMGPRGKTDDRLEDFGTQSIVGQQATWERLAREFGRDYLVATMPMQNWEPTLRQTSYVVQNGTPDGYREMLGRARAMIEQKGLRRFVSIEAWNEWLEGSYVEPSTQWGLGYLEAIRDVFMKR